MATKKDPLDPNFEYDRATVQKYFGRTSDSRAASRLMKENPAAYRSMKNIAAQLDLITPEVPLSARRKQAQEPTPAQAEAMKLFTREEVDRLFRGIGQEPNSKDNLSVISKSDPPKYRMLQLARDGYYGKDSARVEVSDNSHSAQLKKRTEERKLTDELDKRPDVHRFPIHPDLAKLAGVEPGTLITSDDLGKISWAIRHNAQRAEAEAAAKDKPAADADNGTDGNGKA